MLKIIHKNVMIPIFCSKEYNMPDYAIVESHFSRGNLYQHLSNR